MNEKLEKIQRLLEAFKKMHLENSRKYMDGVHEYRELIFNVDWKEEYNLTFQEVKKILRDISKDEEEKSFITYLRKIGLSFPGSPGREELNWNKYVEITESSSNYLKYFENLKKGCVKINTSYRVAFDEDRLNAFCSSIIADLA
ncbi:MAG: hypothetical protein mread185_000079 [Mycoplasmataceae bacterium]|nr:MAG: hypothetical protein mread185_000079 [Mycoplasmataceae bacterium]